MKGEHEGRAGTAAADRKQLKPHYDVFVIGGGINGCGIARDAAGRGYSVCLCEAGDFASGTSSASTKLVHGGLRYLEHYQFRLVREALKEREVLWQMAPHIIWPLRFVLPHHGGLRPAWLLRLGLLLYDHLGGRRLLPPTRTLDLKSDSAGKPLKPLFSRAFEYSDCWVEDSRLVILNARDAADRGADIRPRTRVVSARRQGGHWNIEVQDAASGVRSSLTASLIVNAAGPWVDEVLKKVFGHNDAHNVRLVRGSHIVVGKLFDHGRCYIFQNGDGRIIFAIPYETDYTLIGTTDADHDSTMGKPEITPGEVSYLCAAASEYFARPITQDDVVWSYSGVRPLFDDGASRAHEATRDYVIRQDGNTADGVLLNIFGGKITTYRRLAETIMDRVEAALGKRQPAWTAGACLPGGNFPADGFDALVEQLQTAHGWLDRNTAQRLVRHYGTRAKDVLGGCAGVADAGADFGFGLREAEVRYLVENEWARSAQDILFRRTKLGIRFNAAQVEALQSFVDSVVTDTGNSQPAR
jgi:glycerol-3-phosphate dehydrogenase